MLIAKQFLQDGSEYKVTLQEDRVVTERSNFTNYYRNTAITKIYKREKKFGLNMWVKKYESTTYVDDYSKSVIQSVMKNEIEEFFK